MRIAADALLIDGAVRRGLAVEIDEAGRIVAVGEAGKLGVPDLVLEGRLLMQGMVNAHSHAFQRLLRGQTQRASPGEDNFWSWREAMYRVVEQIEPELLEATARQLFTEMLVAGITTVGEFHYLHHDRGGTRYDDPLALIDPLIRAARDVGIRLVLLDTLYLRGDFDAEPSAAQARFIDRSLEEMAERAELIDQRATFSNGLVGWGVAAHSVRTVPIDAIVGLKTRFATKPFHIHASEQRREVRDCQSHCAATPVELLASHAVLDGMTTLVHATHVSPAEAAMVGSFGSTVCVCPSTEADLGDGITPASEFLAAQAGLALGSDGETVASLIDEARRLETHERLRLERRNVLSTSSEPEVATHLLRAATVGGAKSLGVEAGLWSPGAWADLIAVDLNHLALAGCDDEALPAALVLSTAGDVVRDVIVGGQFVVRDGAHPKAAETAKAYRAAVAGTLVR